MSNTKPFLSTLTTMLLWIWFTTFSFGQTSLYNLFPDSRFNEIRCIHKDHIGNLWIGTNSAGVYQYDGHVFIQYTTNDGLPDNQVLRIQEDSQGDLWFDTGRFNVCKFDGLHFTTFTSRPLIPNNLTKEVATSFANARWFFAGNGVFRYQDNTMFHQPFLPNDTLSDAIQLSRHAVYSICKTKNGHVWFGTQAQGVCLYDGKTYKWFTENGLAGSAVLSIFEDRKGQVWIGINGEGLYQYDGKTMRNITEEKGLGNAAFKLTGASDSKSLARIYAINEDHYGKLWIGTVDAGLWSYDGKILKQYTTKDGLPSNAVNTIFVDVTGMLFLGTDEKGIVMFDGNKFTNFITN